MAMVTQTQLQFINVATHKKIEEGIKTIGHIGKSPTLTARRHFNKLSAIGVWNNSKK